MCTATDFLFFFPPVFPLAGTWLRLNWKLPGFHWQNDASHTQTAHNSVREKRENVRKKRKNQTSVFFFFSLISLLGFAEESHHSLIVTAIFNLLSLLCSMSFSLCPPSPANFPSPPSLRPHPSVCFKSDCHIIMQDVKTTLGELYGVFGIGEGLSLLICFCLSVCLIALAPPGPNACALMTLFMSPSLVFFWGVWGS